MSEVRPCMFLKANGRCDNPPSGDGSGHFAFWQEVILPKIWVCGEANSAYGQNECSGFKELSIDWAVLPENKPKLIG